MGPYLSDAFREQAEIPWLGLGVQEGVVTEFTL